MKGSIADAISIQRAYYSATADKYDDMHVHGDGEHEFAFAFMRSAIEFLEIESVLDIGSGTGRALLRLRATLPRLRVVGIEPSPELRERAIKKGISAAELIDGDARYLQFRDGEFDLVCAYGVLHHIPKPSLAVAEMLRVARRAVFISDANNFGQGQPLVRAIKQAIDSLGLWPLADLIKTRGKGYLLSAGDGLSYSYSVFNNYEQIRAACERVHLLDTTGGSVNLYRSAAHVALLGIKKDNNVPGRSLP